MSLTALYEVLVVVLGIAAVVNVAAQFALLSCVRRRYGGVWQSLGKPRFFSWPYGPLGKQYREFVWSQALAQLGDPILLAARRIIDLSGLVVIVLFVAGVALRWFAHAG